MASWKTIELGPYLLGNTGLAVSRRPKFEEAVAAAEFIRGQDLRSPWFRGDFYNQIKRDFPESYAQLLHENGFDEDQFYRCGWVCERIAPKQRRFIASDLPFEYFAEVAKLSTDDQDALLGACVEQGWRRAELRLNIRLLKRRTVLEGHEPLEGIYRVVYADPPWPYDNNGVIPTERTNTPAYSPAERHYPTMSIESIAAMPVRAHTDDNAVCFLWVPSPLIFDAPTVLSAWGFTYKAQLIWAKGRHVFGNYVSVRHEHLLIATRGSCVPDRLTPMVESVQAVKADGEHSEKPEHFRKIIERLYDGPYLELFARRQVEGWTAHGNQVGALVA